MRSKKTNVAAPLISMSQVTTNALSMRTDTVDIDNKKYTWPELYKEDNPPLSELDKTRRVVSDLIRKYFPLHTPVVTAGYRSLKWDLAKGRNGKSLHTQGRAVDLYLVDQKGKKDSQATLNLMSKAQEDLGCEVGSCTDADLNVCFIHIGLGKKKSTVTYPEKKNCK
jgi:hypothetical protein